MANEKETAVFVTSQISRDCENREDSRPYLVDFEKCTEVYADVIMSIYRDEYYEYNTEKKGIAEIMLIEDTTGWHNNIWGDCTCPKCINKAGKNELGKSLMKVRDILSSDTLK